MLIMPSFQKCLIVEQFQGNYLKVNLTFIIIGILTSPLSLPTLN